MNVSSMQDQGVQNSSVPSDYEPARCDMNLRSRLWSELGHSALGLPCIEYVVKPACNTILLTSVDISVDEIYVPTH